MTKHRPLHLQDPSRQLEDRFREDWEKSMLEDGKPKVYEAHGEGGSHTLSTIPFHGGKEKGSE